MKKSILTLICLLLSVVLLAQNGAYIEYKISSGMGASGSIKINFSEYGHGSVFNMIIPQMPGGGINVKTISNKKTPDLTYNINDKDKTYSEIKKETIEKEDNKTYVVKKIGEETINGYKCIHSTITYGTETEENWNTKDIPDFNKYSESFHSNKRIGSAKKDKALKDAGCDGLPVKSIHKGNPREGDMTMELVKVEKKNFSASDFEIPAGYNKGNGSVGIQGIKSQQEIMKMSPEERNKYIEELKKMGGK